MTEIIFEIVIILLCVLGASELIHILKQKLLTPKILPQTHIIIYLDGETPDLQLISIINECGWSKVMRNVGLIGIYSEISDVSLENCLKISQRHNIKLYSLEEAERINLLDLI